MLHDPGPAAELHPGSGGAVYGPAGPEPSDLRAGTGAGYSALLPQFPQRDAHPGGYCLFTAVPQDSGRLP